MNSQDGLAPFGPPASEMPFVMVSSDSHETSPSIVASFPETQQNREGSDTPHLQWSSGCSILTSLKNIFASAQLHISPINPGTEVLSVSTPLSFFLTSEQFTGKRNAYLSPLLNLDESGTEKTSKQIIALPMMAWVLA